MFNLNDLLNSFFNKEEFDWEKAKQTGKVEESEETSNGVKTITRRYTDENGNKYSYTSSSYVGFEEKISKQKQIAELENKIKEAIEKEEFEKAAELRDQKNKLK